MAEQKRNMTSSSEETKNKIGIKIMVKYDYIGLGIIVISESWWINNPGKNWRKICVWSLQQPKNICSKNHPPLMAMMRQPILFFIIVNIRGKWIKVIWTAVKNWTAVKDKIVYWYNYLYIHVTCDAEKAI